MKQVLQDSICRICGCEDAVFINLLNPKHFKLLDLVQTLLSIEVKPEDCLPKDICPSCITTLDEFQKLELSCRRIQRRLTDEQVQLNKEQNKSCNLPCHRVSVITEVRKASPTKTTVPTNSSRRCAENESEKVQISVGCVGERSATSSKIVDLNVASKSDDISLQNEFESETTPEHNKTNLETTSSIVIKTNCFPHHVNQLYELPKADNPGSEQMSGKTLQLISDIFVTLLQEKKVPNRNIPSILESYLNRSRFYGSGMCSTNVDESSENHDIGSQEQILPAACSRVLGEQKTSGESSENHNTGSQEQILPAACSKVLEEQEALDEIVRRDTAANDFSGKKTENINTTESSRLTTTSIEVPSKDSVFNESTEVIDKKNKKKSSEPSAATMTMDTKTSKKQSDRNERIKITVMKMMVKPEEPEMNYSDPLSKEKCTSDISASKSSGNVTVSKAPLMDEVVKVKKEPSASTEHPLLPRISVPKVPHGQLKPFEITLSRAKKSIKPEKNSSGGDKEKSDAGKKSSCDGWFIYSIPESSATLHVCQKCKTILLSEAARNEHQCGSCQPVKEEKECPGSTADRLQQNVITLKRNSSRDSLNYDNGTESYSIKKKKK